MNVSFLIRAGLVKPYYAATCYPLLAERFSM